MVKAYLRYEQSGSFGVIAASGSLAYDPKTGLLASAALEDIGIWNVKQASLVRLARRNEINEIIIRRLASALCI